MAWYGDPGFVPTVGQNCHLVLDGLPLIVREGSYTKRPAPQFGARIATGDPSYNNLSLWQHWVQKCWVGGMGADQWVDDAMFDAAVGVDTTQHEVARLARDLGPGGGINWALNSRETIKRFYVYVGRLLVWTAESGQTSTIWEYDKATDGWINRAVPANMLIRSVVGYMSKFWVAGWVGTTIKMYWCTPQTGDWTWHEFAVPAGITSADYPYAMFQFNQKVYVAFGTKVWRLKSDLTWDGNTVFYTATQGRYIVAMEAHLGFLYMLSVDGHIHRSDGNNTFDIWNWDGQVQGVSLRSYDGKLFVGTFEYGDDSTKGFGVLYQFSGAAVTELKRWGAAGKATTVGNMVVHNRKLYYGASSLLGEGSGFGVAVYDAREDGHSIFASNCDGVTYPDSSGYGRAWMVDDVVVFGGILFAGVRGHGIVATLHEYRDARTGRATYPKWTAWSQMVGDPFVTRMNIGWQSPYDGNRGWIRSSMYDAGTPGIEKFWSKVTVFADVPVGTSVQLTLRTQEGGPDIVADDPDRFVAPGVLGKTRYVFWLGGLKSPRLQWTVSLESQDRTKSPVLRAVVVDYLPEPEPNWMWSFTVPLADYWELPNGVTVEVGSEEFKRLLEAKFRAGVPVTFTDVDGTQWATDGTPGVLIYDITTVHFSVDRPLEGDVRITLLETIESY